MKVFWLILGLCILAAGVLVYRDVADRPDASATDNTFASSDSAESPATTSSAPAMEAEESAHIPAGGTSAGHDDDERAALTEELLASSADRDTGNAQPRSDRAVSRDGSSLGSSRAAGTSEDDDAALAETWNASGDQTDPAATGGAAMNGEAASSDGAREVNKQSTPGSATEAVTHRAAVSTSSTEPLEPAELAIEAIKGTTLVDSTFERQSDGSLVADERYVIRGKGTKDKPYEISWDMLISASQTYQPRLGETALPGRIAMLHEKHVRITGYLAFPVSAESFDEMLVMLNQWDGCCIGVPPSPYDAIEVKLAEPVNIKKRHMFVYGSVEGRLLVEPYLINEWLVGLYLMQDAKVELDY